LPPSPATWIRNPTKKHKQSQPEQQGTEKTENDRNNKIHKNYTSNIFSHQHDSSPSRKLASIRKLETPTQQHHSKNITPGPASANIPLTSTQSKYKNNVPGLMYPSQAAAAHPAYNTLLNYARFGCPVDCGSAWTIDQLTAAANRGAHPSAKTAHAAACLRAEALEKVNQGFAKLVLWSELLKNPPPNLKISPLAAVPHKSRDYRAILDLSFTIRLFGIPLSSVNAGTIPFANPIVMQQLGQVLPRIVAGIAESAPDNGPIFFAKWDIKDGFWRLVVSAYDAWNFCYVLPAENATDPIQIVVPTSLQMGWCESPAFFCTASETARDLAQAWLATTQGSLPYHPMESECMPQQIKLPNITTATTTAFLELLEVYVDDFIGAIQASNLERLLHFTRAILHGIHAIFPPPAITGHAGGDPISEKKLKLGDGTWAIQKEILGWMFDGLNRTMRLPPEKVIKVTTTITSITRSHFIQYKALERLHGQLQHAAIGIPTGKGLLSPVIATLA